MLFRSKGSFFDIIILLITFLLTVLVDLTVAIQIGVVLAALLFMKRMADNAPSVINSLDEDVAGIYKNIPANIGIYEISGPFFFASAKVYSETIREIGLSQKQAGVGELYLARLLIIHQRHSRISRIEARVCEQNIVIEIAFVNFASPFEELYRRRKIPAREHF